MGSLVATINGANSAGGDDYLPLFCYVIMKGMPQHLPSQLQTAKVISQRKEQDKFFIDCCVAMKALRNFCNVLFEDDQEPQEPVTENTETTKGNDEKPVTEDKEKSNGNKSSLFNTLRSKLPQRAAKQNGNSLFNNLSPSHFMNKKNSSRSPSPARPEQSPPKPSEKSEE